MRVSLSGLHNKNITDGLAYTTKLLFLTVLEAGNSKKKAPADSVSGGVLFPGS